MKYAFNVKDKPIIDRILEINNTNLSELDVTDFKVDTDIDIINEFKEKLLENRAKRFLIVGDYDCDGICATAIMKKLLDDLKINCNYYIPSRTRQGYGLNEEIVNNAKNNNFDCLICVDNGVAAIDSLSKCKEYGIEVFIIDHHEYTEMPDCECLLHPDLFVSKYEDMCAGGLCALISNSFRYVELNDVYGGLATLADMVSVFNYNRYLIKKMLAIIKKGNIDPINYLLGNIEATYQSIQFNVIPKINAVSRLDEYMNVNYVVKYLLSVQDECLKYFDKIEHINRARKDCSKKMHDLASGIMNSDADVILMAHTDFKEGLCGLVANRILSETAKPVIIFSIVGNQLKGSGRAPVGFNLYEYLYACKDLFTNFGGHGQAVGLNMPLDSYDKLTDYIDKHPIESIAVSKDVLVLDANDIDSKLIEDLDSLRPFGTGFTEPLLALNNKYESKFVVAKKYPKFIINENLSAISFNCRFIDTEFAYMIGRITNDDYSKGKLSFIIEDLV